MDIIVVGISHKTANVDVREQVFLSETDRTLFLHEIMRNRFVKECFVLSTCSRTEIYATVTHPALCCEDIIHRLITFKKLGEPSAIRHHFYIYTADEAIGQLFKVACGLDSRLIGEPQILGQVKKSIETAREQSMMGRYLNILTNIAIQTGKKARHDTNINYGGTSASWAAVEMAESIVGTLEDKSILVIGAGKMGSIAARQLGKKKVSELYVLNRTYEKAEKLARRLGGKALSLYKLGETLRKVDVCICSSNAPHYILDKTTMAEIMRDREQRPLALIDIAIPRNIDPAVAKLDHITLLDIDDMKEQTSVNFTTRLQAITEVEELISRKIGEFHDKIEHDRSRMQSVPAVARQVMANSVEVAAS